MSFRGAVTGLICRSGVALAMLALVATVCALPARAAPDVCKFTVVSGVGFGSYDVFNASPTVATGTIRYECSNFPAGGEVVTLQFSRGNAATYSPRIMLNGAQQMQYNLYLDAAYTKIWGDGTGGTSFYSQNTLNGVGTSVTIFGRIPAGQDLTVGPYTDTITVTMNW
jgi:spore coat protein U-like protein